MWLMNFNELDIQSGPMSQRVDYMRLAAPADRLSKDDSEMFYKPVINAQPEIPYRCKRMYNNIKQITYLVVAMYQDNAQVGWLQLASILYGDIVPLADVVDVNRDASIRTWRGRIEASICKTVLHYYCYYDYKYCQASSRKY